MLLLKPWLLRLHGWLTVLFIVPIAFLIVTGLILSIEPILQSTPVPSGSMSTEKVLGYLKAHDPEGKARGLTVYSYETTLTIQGAGPQGSVDIDLATGSVADIDEGVAWSDLFGPTRGLHEHLHAFGMDWAVPGTIVMLTIMALGILMGLPRIRNTIGGWHKGVAWFGLPLLIASPLTAIFLAAGITLNPSPAPSPARTSALPIAEAVAVIGKSGDLGTLIWLRNRGGRQLARLNEGGEFRVYAVTRDGLVPTPRNYVRLFHEGNFAGAWSGVMNVIISLALIGLLGTGVWLFIRKQVRKMSNRRQRALTAQLAE